MALVRRSAKNLLAEANADRLHTVLAEQARMRFDTGVGPGEVRSWQRSLPAFLDDVVDAGLGHVEVLVEHRLPHSPMRVDIVLCGTSPEDGLPVYVLVELKQWSSAQPAGDDLVRIDHYAHPVLHPVEQVRRYCEYLVDATPRLAEMQDSVHGIAYLHNADSAGVQRISQYPVDRYGQLYTMDDRASMIDRLRSLLESGPGSRDRACQAADELLNFHHAPSKPLLERAAREVKDRKQFILLGQQQVAYSLVMGAVRKAGVARRQTVVIVLGGPGSGKSVIALSLLGQLAREGRAVYHATGSSAFTNTLRQNVGVRDRRVRAMFKYFNNFIDAEKFGLDVLICDESHRIRETSVNRFSTREMRAKARRQIEELIDAARVPVFLLDQHQIVRPGEMGSLQEIQAIAEALDCDVEIVQLDGQYRCGGSKLYEMWVERLLGLSDRAACSWSSLVSRTDDSYVVRCAGSPHDIESWLFARQSRDEGTARMSAGYCWRWSDPVANGAERILVPDVTIDDWSRPWNAKPGTKVADAPESYYWASDERGFGQVGCIYTAQGFEYDWSGVIFGPDFVRRGDAWKARPQFSHDPAVKKAAPPQFHALIRNTYKVLLTRGMRGVCLYSTDPETQQFFERTAR